jgi:hypothetical protein
MYIYIYMYIYIHIYVYVWQRYSIPEPASVRREHAPQSQPRAGSLRFSRSPTRAATRAVSFRFPRAPIRAWAPSDFPKVSRSSVAFRFSRSTHTTCDLSPVLLVFFSFFTLAQHVVSLIFFFPFHVRKIAAQWVQINHAHKPYIFVRKTRVCEQKYCKCVP